MLNVEDLSFEFFFPPNIAFPTASGELDEIGSLFHSKGISSSMMARGKRMLWRFIMSNAPRELDAEGT